MAASRVLFKTSPVMNNAAFSSQTLKQTALRERRGTLSDQPNYSSCIPDIRQPLPPASL